MAQQKLDLALRGLYTSPNNLSGVPAGALEVADNVVINSKNLIESRRGLTQYGDPLAVGVDQVNKLFNYASSLIVSYADKLAYDSGNGAWVDYLGTYTAPATTNKMRSLEALQNFYFTTSKGIYKIDSLSATPKAAGAIKALGGTGTTTGASGFLVDDSSVAYRIVWGYRDANQNLLLGVPSERVIVSNATGGDKDVLLTFIIPDGITSDYFYQIYRSTGTATVTDEPTDQLFQVIEGKPTAGEIIAKSFSVTDSTPYSLMRAALYTNADQEGIENANYPPPFALDMDVFKTCAFYANVKQKQQKFISMISVDSPSFGYVTEATATTSSGSPIVGSIADTTLLRVGMRVVGSGIQANSVILTIDSPTQITMDKNATATSGSVSLEFQDRLTVASVNYWGGSAQNVSTNTFLVETGGSPGTNITDTVSSLVEVINTSASNTTVYAYSLSGVEDLPGQILIEERDIGGATFYLTSTAGDSFNPVLPASGTTVASTNDQRQNRVMVSKPSQVEAVPLYRYFDIGSANFPIQRVVALRDGIFFFKQDGIFRISGETFQNFTVTLLDNTAIIKVPESAVAFNNQVFCFTTQGVVAVTDSGVQIMSVPIENQLLELSSAQYTNFASASFGVAYESARLYMFFTVTQEDDEFATQAFVYNSLTDSWTRWIMDRTCGVVNSAVNKLFMAQTDTGQVLIERKSFTSDDYADEQYPVVILSVDSNTQLTLVSAALVEPGMTLVQSGRRAYITEVSGDVITTVPVEGFDTGPADVYTPILNLIQWAPIDAENPGILKQFSECTFFFKNAAFREISAGFASNISTGFQVVEMTNRLGGGWGTFNWGTGPWGGAPGGMNVLRTYVPREIQRCSWMKLYLSTEEAFTGFSLQGVSLIFNPMSSRFR